MASEKAHALNEALFRLRKSLVGDDALTPRPARSADSEHSGSGQHTRDLPKRQAAARALAKLMADEVCVRRAELGALERSLAALERAGRGVGPGVACAGNADDCDGAVAARYCATCGAVVARCVAHGGSRGAAYALRHHTATCGDEPADTSEAGDA